MFFDIVEQTDAVKQVVKIFNEEALIVAKLAQQDYFNEIDVPKYLIGKREFIDDIFEAILEFHDFINLDLLLPSAEHIQFDMLPAKYKSEIVRRTIDRLEGLCVNGNTFKKEKIIACSKLYHFIVGISKRSDQNKMNNILANEFGYEIFNIAKLIARINFIIANKLHSNNMMSREWVAKKKVNPEEEEIHEKQRMLYKINL